MHIVSVSCVRTALVLALQLCSSLLSSFPPSSKSIRRLLCKQTCCCVNPNRDLALQLEPTVREVVFFKTTTSAHQHVHFPSGQQIHHCLLVFHPPYLGELSSSPFSLLPLSPSPWGTTILPHVSPFHSLFKDPSTSPQQARANKSQPTSFITTFPLFCSSSEHSLRDLEQKSMLLLFSKQPPLLSHLHPPSFSLK